MGLVRPRSFCATGLAAFSAGLQSDWSVLTCSLQTGEMAAQLHSDFINISCQGYLKQEEELGVFRILLP